LPLVLRAPFVAKLVPEVKPLDGVRDTVCATTSRGDARTISTEPVQSAARRDGIVVE
jgi:hypothetical protein